MKHLLNTLYVTTQGAYLAREGETVLVRTDGEVKLRIPIHTLGGIVCFGRVMCSPALMGLCGKNSVAISHLSKNGRFLARIEGPVSGNVLLRREQYRRADDEHFAAGIARAVVTAKVANCRTVLLRAIRERSESSETEAMKVSTNRLGRLLDELKDPVSVSVVRGKEGDAARVYFDVFDYLITAQKKDFFFHERSRRPPLDNMNAMLSFVYTLLAHDVAAALSAVGLDPAVGYLHTDRPGHNGLALDLMEEFRPYLADRLALSLVNLQQVKPQGFRKTETGAVMMDDVTRKEVLVAYQKRKREEITHPFLGEKIQVGLVPHVQAMLLARYLRGDLDGYPPFILK